MIKWLLYAVTGTQQTVLENIIKTMSGRKEKKRKGKKNPSELNKTVWLKFKQGWSLFLTQWLSAYAGPRSLCPRPQSLWRARSFYIFTKWEENKLLTHSWSGAEETLWLQLATLPPHSLVWKPVCLSRMQCAAPVFFCLSYIPVPEASVTFRTQQKVERVLSCQDERQAISPETFFFHLLLLILLDPIYFFLSFFQQGDLW